MNARGSLATYQHNRTRRFLQGHSQSAIRLSGLQKIRPQVSSELSHPLPTFESSTEYVERTNPLRIGIARCPVRPLSCEPLAELCNSSHPESCFHQCPAQRILASKTPKDLSFSQ